MYRKTHCVVVKTYRYTPTCCHSLPHSDCSERSACHVWMLCPGGMQVWGVSQLSPGLPVDRMFLGMVTLSSELRAQSTMPLQPFMGKLMSAWPSTGRLWMLKTETQKWGQLSLVTTNQYSYFITFLTLFNSYLHFVCRHTAAVYKLHVAVHCVVRGISPLSASEIFFLMKENYFLKSRM